MYILLPYFPPKLGTYSLTKREQCSAENKTLGIVILLLTYLGLPKKSST